MARRLWPAPATPRRPAVCSRRRTSARRSAGQLSRNGRKSWSRNWLKKGSVVKIGQMMALFGEHFLPEEVTEALHTLENSTTALEWPAVEKHLRQQLGSVKLAELEVDPQPLGAASLGQVHRARRKSDGAELALKIQYPGVANAIDSDMRAVRLLKLSRLVPITEQFNQWLDEVRDMLGREVDYDLEAHTTRHFREALADDPRFVVPEVYGGAHPQHSLPLLRGRQPSAIRRWCR